VVSLLFFASPTAVLYENWLYVEHVVVGALIAAALCLHLFASGRGTRYAAAAFSALALVVLVRTMFHPAWLLAVVALVWLMQPGRRREVLIAAAVPVLLVGLVQAKALVQFGSTSMTSCTGLSVFRVTTAQVPYDERRALVAEGVASPYALENPIFLTTTRPERFRAEPRRGVAVLDRAQKSTGHVNVGHAAYLDLCPQYSRDGLKIARERPGDVRRGLQKGFELYWRPASDYALFDARNRESVEGIERASALALGQLDRDRGSTDFSLRAQLDEIAWLLVLGYVAVFVVGGPPRRRSTTPRDRRRRVHPVHDRLRDRYRQPARVWREQPLPLRAGSAGSRAAYGLGGAMAEAAAGTPPVKSTDLRRPAQHWGHVPASVRGRGRAVER
jgi:hypothetical protein